MSWSFQCIGKPDKVAEALEAHSATLSGQGKIEFDAALPHLSALVRENFVDEGAGPGYAQPFLDFEAYGSGWARENGSQVSRSCAVSIKPISKTLV